jgi:hypothetical protein
MYGAEAFKEVFSASVIFARAVSLQYTQQRCKNREPKSQKGLQNVALDHERSRTQSLACSELAGGMKQDLQRLSTPPKLEAQGAQEAEYWVRQADCRRTGSRRCLESGPVRGR